MRHHAEHLVHGDAAILEAHRRPRHVEPPDPRSALAHEGHRILGVCNPGFAKRALDVDRDVALLLPCTVTLREVEGGTEVHVLDPEEAFQVAAPETRARLEPLAGEVKGLLVAAVAALRSA